MSPIKKMKMIVLVSAIGMLGPAGAVAAPSPIDPIEIDRSSDTSFPLPHVSPQGNQFLTYRTAIPGGSGYVIVERKDGGPFSSPFQIVPTGNADEPSVSFTPDGGVYVVQGLSPGGSLAQQTYRVPGGEFVPPVNVDTCGRFVDSAAGPEGQIAVACSHSGLTSPPDNFRLGTAPVLGPVTVSEDIFVPVFDPFIQPKVSWGRDGTLAMAADFFYTTVDPPPVNQTKRTRVVVRNAAQGVSATADLMDVTEPNQSDLLGEPAVLDDGTVAITTGGTAGARVHVRPPGPLAVFTAQSLNGEDATTVQADDAQNLHAMSADAEPPGRQYWSSVRPPGGTFGPGVPIPLAGVGDPFIPFEGFEVAPDGTEYALIRADDGIYATSRAPGEASFSTPQFLGSAPMSNPEGAVTPDGDLLVTWATEIAPMERAAYVGGLDGTDPVVTVESFPVATEAGIPLEFRARAEDSMGLRSIVWDFGGGNTANAESATHSFGPGKHKVSFTATDRAGNRTVVARTVEVPGGPGPGGNPPKMKLAAPKKLKFRALARRGVKLKVSADRPIRIKAVIGTSKRNARLRPMAKKSIAKYKARHTLRVKPKRKRLGKPRKFKLYVKVTGTTAAGEVMVRAKKVRILR